MHSDLRPAPHDSAPASSPPSSDPFHAPPLARRSLLMGATASAFLAPALFGEHPAEAAAPPYPPSSIRLGRVDVTWLWKRGVRADQWVSGEIDRSHILAAWGDGYGWNPSGRKGQIGVSYITGSVAAPTGGDLWRETRQPLKPCAVIANSGPPLIFAVSDRDGRSSNYLLLGSADRRSYSLVGSPILTRARHRVLVVGTFDPLDRGQSAHRGSLRRQPKPSDLLRLHP
jgi:hypothetical protein